MYLVSAWIITQINGRGEQRMAEVLEEFWKYRDIKYVRGLLDVLRVCQDAPNGGEWWW